jgi:hypothetical protein
VALPLFEPNRKAPTRKGKPMSAKRVKALLLEAARRIHGRVRGQLAKLA